MITDPWLLLNEITLTLWNDNIAMITDPYCDNVAMITDPYCDNVAMITDPWLLTLACDNLTMIPDPRWP
jgi:hypothetical protein